MKRGCTRFLTDVFGTRALHRSLIVVLAAGLLSGACSPSDDAALSADGTAGGTEALGTGSAQTAAEPDTTTQSPGIDQSQSQTQQGSVAKKPLNPQGGRLRPLKLSFKPVVRVNGSVEPLCVAPGQLVTLSVVTKPEAAIGYQAVYSDNRGGSPEPFGAGYGGNDKGYAAADGTFTSSWTVGPDAPAGRARVDVILGYKGKWGYDDPHFAVADDDGNCPQEWIEENGRG